MAIKEVACKAIWLRRILNDIQHKESSSTIIMFVNVLAIAMKKNQVFHYKTKHLEISVQKKEIQIEFANTTKQLVDIFTKTTIAKKPEDFKKITKITN